MRGNYEYFFLGRLVFRIGRWDSVNICCLLNIKWFVGDIIMSLWRRVITWFVACISGSLISLSVVLDCPMIYRILLLAVGVILVVGCIFYCFYYTIIKGGNNEYEI